MIIFAAILGILLLLLLLFLFLPLSVGVEYWYQDAKQTCFLRLRIFGIPLKIRIPVSEKTKKKEKTPKEEKPKKKLTFSRLKGIFYGIRDAYKETKADIRKLFSDLRKELTVESLMFHLHFGLDNAAKTGIATGAAWASSSCALAAIHQMLSVKHADLNVVPDFNTECMRIYVKSIFRFRPVHIISIGARALKIVNYFIEKIEVE
ncbi:MAG: DUF2953 domain-containing protein [Clostridia bacterium]|nr:DUF2953 domain-containing protein [Clostridia bacterium]